MSPVEPAKDKPVGRKGSAFKVPHGLSLKEREYQPSRLCAEGKAVECPMARARPAELLGPGVTGAEAAGQWRSYSSGAAFNLHQHCILLTLLISVKILAIEYLYTYFN